MTEEKKEEKIVSQEPAQEAAKVQQTVDAKPAAQEAQESNAPAQEVKKPEVKPEVKKEKPSNCAGCNKSIRKKRWYYRNGKSYCTKRCWQSAVKKETSAGEDQALKQ